MKAPTHTATSQVKIRCLQGVQPATPNSHREMKSTRTSGKNEETAVMKLRRTFGIDRAPIVIETTPAAIKALLVVGLMILTCALPNDPKLRQADGQVAPQTR
jgi:hypothetical protein